MPVYVDKMRAKYRGMIMCHMVADTLQELHTMASKLGLKKKWFQQGLTSLPHYDICLAKKRLAISNGATEISNGKLVAMIREHRKNKVQNKHK